MIALEFPVISSRLSFSSLSPGWLARSKAIGSIWSPSGLLASGRKQSSSFSAAAACVHTGSTHQASAPPACLSWVVFLLYLNVHIEHTDLPLLTQWLAIAYSMASQWDGCSQTLCLFYLYNVSKCMYIWILDTIQQQCILLFWKIAVSKNMK